MTPKEFVTACEQTRREGRRDGKRRALTCLHVKILALIAHWRGPYCSHRLVARAARCSKETVKRACAIARDFGLLSWDRQTVSLLGWRAQTANAYRLRGGAIGHRTITLREEKGGFSRSRNLTPPATGAGPGPLILARRAALAAAQRAATQSRAQRQLTL